MIQMTPRFLSRSLPSVGFALTIPLLALSACTSPTATDTTSETPEAASDSEPVKMALVLSGSSNDQSWDQAAFEAGEELKGEGVEVAVSEAVDPANAAGVLRQYASEGYSLIVAHSFSYQDAVFEVAQEFPDVNFAWAGGIDGTAENVADYDQPFYQGAYLVGLVAAELSKTGQLGALYGFDIPACHAMGEAMLAGAKSVRPEVTLVSTAVGDWYDVAKAKEAALSQAETGVDYWIGCGQGPTLGEIEAAKDVDGYATSYVGDMSSLGPDVVAANLIWNMEPLFKEMLGDTAGDTFADKYYQLGVPDDVITVEVNPKFESQVGEATLSQVKETESGIASGKVEVPFVPE